MKSSGRGGGAGVRRTEAGHSDEPGKEAGGVGAGSGTEKAIILFQLVGRI